MTPTRADLGKQPAEVAAMFDDVAPRYDLVNDVLSLGQDRIWRKAVARAVGAAEGEKVLDVAAGTGTSSASFTTAGADCVACDFSLGMLRQGARQRGGADVGGVCFVAGDALALPFADESFDAVTISFGLRNVHDVDAALRDLRRVTKPGGRLVICEFSSPTWTPFRRLYDAYLGRRAFGGEEGQLQPRLLRLSRGVDQGLASPGGAGPADPSRGLEQRRLA